MRRAADRRTHRFTVRVSRALLRAILRAARTDQRTPSDYMRRVLRDATMPDAQPADADQR
jgi:hypothetical protein